MAEETTIPLEDGSASSSVEVGLESTSTDVQPGTPAGNIAAEELQTRIAELTRMNEQYLRERRGWETQSRRNMDEAQTLRERLANIEGRLSTQVIPGQQEHAAPQYSPGQLKRGLKSWLDGKEEDLDEVEQALARTVQASQRQGQTTPDPAEYKRLIREELMELGQRSTVQSIVGQNHPDMQNPQSDLSRAVWDAYDNFASAPATQFLFPKDPRFDVAMLGADGTSRMVDARLVDRLAADVRLKAGIQEGRRQESRASGVGGVQTSAGRGGHTKQAVEAAELLTPGELALLQDPKIRKGWGKMPDDPKAAAKYFYDGLTTAEKARRLAAYRSRS